MPPQVKAVHRLDLREKKAGSLGFVYRSPERRRDVVLAHPWGCLGLRGWRRRLPGGQQSRTVVSGPSGDALDVAARKWSPEHIS